MHISHVTGNYNNVSLNDRSTIEVLVMASEGNDAITRSTYIPQLPNSRQSTRLMYLVDFQIVPGSTVQSVHCRR